MKLRALSGTMTFALVVALSGYAAAQDARPDDTAPKPAEPAPQPTDSSTQPAPAQPPPPPAPEPSLAPPPPPELVAPPPMVEAPVVAPEPGNRFIFDAALGYTAGGAVKHPDLSGKNFSGEMLELGFGTELDPKLQLVVAFTSFMTTLERVGASKDFKELRVGSPSGVHPLAAGDGGGGNQGGGILVKTPLHVHTLGPRLDYLPLGSTGPYVGVTAGLAVMQDLDFRGGAAAAARIGYELRAFSSLGVSLEAGAHGQVYSDSSAILPYAALQLTLLDPFTLHTPAPAQKLGGKANPTRL